VTAHPVPVGSEPEVPPAVLKDTPDVIADPLRVGLQRRVTVIVGGVAILGERYRPSLGHRTHEGRISCCAPSLRFAASGAHESYVNGQDEMCCGHGNLLPESSASALSAGRLPRGRWTQHALRASRPQGAKPACRGLIDAGATGLSWAYVSG